MKKTILTLALLLGISLSLFAQREIPMFFDRELKLETSNSNRFFRNVTYSQDGNRVAVTFGSNKKIAIWDSVSGREIARLAAGHDESGIGITGIVFSPNGRQLVSFASLESTIKIWDTQSGVLIRNITQSGVSAIVFSPDGNRIAGAYSGAGGVYGVKIWNAANGSEIRTLTGHTGIVNSVIYSPNGTQILTTSRDGSIRIWDASNGQNIRTINSEISFRSNAVYTPNGQCIVVYIQGVIRLFNSVSGQEIRSIPVLLNNLNFACSPDNRYLLTNIRDDNDNIFINVFDLDTGRELRSFNNSDNVVAFSSDGRKIFTSSSFSFKIGDTTYGASYAGILDATTGRTIGTIGYGPLNVGAKAFADLQIARFLGDTAAAARHEAVLKFITDKGYAARQEIEAFYRDNVRALIAGVVDAEFNKISFMVDINSQTSYNCVLTRNAQNQYVLNYNSYFGTDARSKREVSGTSLEALSSAMSRSGDFPAAAINEVSAQAKLIPAVAFSTTEVQTIKNELTNFYLNQNRDTLLVIQQRYRRLSLAERERGVVASTALHEIVFSLNPELARRVTTNN